MISIGGCFHYFCKNCMVDYITYKINCRETVLCPEEGCPQKLTKHSPLFLLLNHQIRDRFREQELWRQTVDNPNVKLCPGEYCKEGIVDMRMNPPQCRNCRRLFCAKCMMVYHEGSCDRNFQLHFKDFRKCPNCGISIQRIQGCNQI